GQERKVGEPLILDQGLTHLTATTHNVNQMVDDSVLEPQDDIEIPQADVTIEQHDFALVLGQAEAEVGGCRGLADPTLARGNDNSWSAHNSGPPIVSPDRVQSQSVRP